MASTSQPKRYRWTHLLNTWVTYSYQQQKGRVVENTISWEIHFQEKRGRGYRSVAGLASFVKAYSKQYNVKETYAKMDSSTCAGRQKFATSKLIHDALRKKHAAIFEQIKQEISVFIAKPSNTSTKRSRRARPESISPSTTTVSSHALYLGVYYMLQSISGQSSPNKYIIIMNQLAEVIDEKDATITTLQVGGSQMQTSPIQTSQIIPFIPSNITKITHALTPMNYSRFNQCIYDFYGLSTVKCIDYSMPTKCKLKEWNIDLNAANVVIMSKRVKRVKEYHRKRFKELYTMPYFTDSKKEMIETMILRKQYADALDILRTQDYDEEHVNPYYKDVYKIICYQAQYMLSSMDIKNKYFMEMMDTFALLSLTLSPLTNSLFADTLLHYNPNALTESDIQFICNLVISASCFMHANSDVYEISGSIDANMLLLRLIRDETLSANDTVFKMIVDTMDALFAAFDGRNWNDVSKCFYLRICHAKMLWQIEKKEIMKTTHNVREKISMDVYGDNEMKVQEKIEKIECKVCGRAFKNVKALAGHYNVHSTESTKRRRKKSCKRRRISTHGKVGKPSCKEESIESDASEGVVVWKPKTTAARNRKKKVEILRCDFCEYRTDHKGNFKRHIKTHAETQVKSETNVIILDDVKINESDRLQCNVCGKLCKTKSGVGTHKYHAHGIKKNAPRKKEGTKRKRKSGTKKKRTAIIIQDSETESEVEILNINTNNKKKMKFGCDDCGRTFDSFAKLTGHRSTQHISIKTDEFDDIIEYHDFNVKNSV